MGSLICLARGYCWGVQHLRAGGLSSTFFLTEVYHFPGFSPLLPGLSPNVVLEECSTSEAIHSALRDDL